MTSASALPLPLKKAVLLNLCQRLCPLLPQQTLLDYRRKWIKAKQKERKHVLQSLVPMISLFLPCKINQLLCGLFNRWVSRALSALDVLHETVWVYTYCMWIYILKWIHSSPLTVPNPTAIRKLLSQQSEYQCQNRNCSCIFFCQNSVNWEFYRSWNCHTCTKPRAGLQRFSIVHSLFIGWHV